jgi:alkyldihydroxyacetonephosphate synthase
MNREEIVANLKQILTPDQVITDSQALKEASIDRFKKYQSIHETFVMPIPSCIVIVRSAQEVSDVLKFLNENRINCIPRTGGSATEGGLENRAENSVVVDGSEMNKILNIDTYNMQATAQCGVSLQHLDDLLRKQGFTTGHSPQSKPVADMGGLVATRSIGQFSTLYGGIEDMVVGLEAVFPDGTITRIKNVPRRAAGPDIRHVIIGSEGALCYITEVTVKIFPYLPQNNRFYGYTLDSMKTGFEILREVMVEGYRPSIARLYDLEDAAMHFSHFEEGKCVIIFMAEGPAGITKATGDAIEEIVARYPECEKVDSKLIETWFNGLNWTAEMLRDERREILETGNIGFTTEVSGNWSCIYDIYDSCIKRIREEIPDLTLLGGHSSHSYINGTNMYFVYYYNVVDCSPVDEIAKYHEPLNKIIVEETLKHGGSMVHHHGVGKARQPYIRLEHGSAYYILDKLKKAFDPNGIMNVDTIFERN